MAQPVVETRSGRVSGERLAGVDVFRGIPFAAAPVAGLRWSAPAREAPWRGVRSARAFGPSAPQRAGFVSRILGADGHPSDEDCLSVNLWTPACDDGRRPVLVWIHGGGFTVGAGSWPVYDGAALARHGDAVVVSLNYRLGALGFLALEGLEPAAAGGNLGLLDQIAGLEWVREHAHAFGGDPERVTLFANSAGAMSAATLLAVPRAKGLFRAAILQSGAASNVHDGEDAARVASTVARELDTTPDDLAALRRVPVEALLDAQVRAVAALRGVVRQLPFQPWQDGALLPRPPLESIAAGDAAPVPLLVGTNLEEWRLYGLADPKLASLDDAALLRRLARAVPGDDASGTPHAARIAAVYREARRGVAPIEPAELWLAIETDRWFRHPATQLAEHHRADVWAYLFTWRSPAADGRVGACHALEVPFVFGGVSSAWARDLVGDAPGAVGLSRAIQDAWLAFARGEPPASESLPAWPRYTVPLRATLRLGAECRVEEAPAEAERAIWQTLA